MTKGKRLGTATWYDLLERHPYRVTLANGAETRTLYVSSIAAAKSGLEVGWRVSTVDRWDADRRCWEAVTAF
jgi:hypothetical protein